MNENKETKWLDLDELSEYIHLQKAYIYKLINQGRLPFPVYKPAGKLYFDRVEVDNYIRTSKPKARKNTGQRGRPRVRKIIKVA